MEGEEAAALTPLTNNIPAQTGVLEAPRPPFLPISPASNGLAASTGAIRGGRHAPFPYPQFTL